MFSVCLCAECKAMKVLYDASDSRGSIYDWMKIKLSESTIFNYWKMVLDLQTPILMFVRAQREHNFSLYVQVLRRIIN